jgi:hypothetical protein
MGGRGAAAAATITPLARPPLPELLYACAAGGVAAAGDAAAHAAPGAGLCGCAWAGVPPGALRGVAAGLTAALLGVLRVGLEEVDSIVDG